jgi:putative transposase
MTGKIIEVNEEMIKDHLRQFVKNTNEETLNSMLDAEADALCNAQMYERSTDRQNHGWTL